MPARDRIHDQVKNALIKAGWTITHDPLPLKYGERDMYVDLGAEQLLAAEKGSRKIAVEIKTFGGRSEIADLQDALGQFVFYHEILAKLEPERELFLAIGNETLLDLFSEATGKLFIDEKHLKIIAVRLDTEEIVTWIP